MSDVGLISESSIRRFEPCFTSDVWLLEDIRIKPHIPHYLNFKSFRFSSIANDDMRLAVKLYIYHRMTMGISLNTCKADLSNITQFARYLQSRYPQVNAFCVVTRQMFEDFISSLKEQGKSNATIQNNVVSIRCFFEKGSYVGIKNLPQVSKIIKASDYLKPNSEPTRPYSQAEITRILSCIPYMDSQIARLLFLICNVIIRFSEASGLRADSLKVNENGEYSLVIELYKTRRSHIVPITGSVAEIIMKAIEFSRDRPGNTSGYAFYDKADHPITRTVFVASLQKVVKSLGILDDNGLPLHIATHRFRASLVTEYINSGVDVESIRMLLGHKSSEALWRYARIHSKTAVELMGPVMEKRSSFMKGNNGNFLEEKPVQESMCLSNGTCERALDAGVCEEAHQCYDCIYFKSDARFLGIYKRQLYETQRLLNYAEGKGMKRIIEQSQRTIKGLRKAIEQAEKDRPC